jgi:transcriptional regulator with GAF, ATPase, and Fis domain
MNDREYIEMLTKENEVLRHGILALEGEKARIEARLQSVPPLLDEVDRLRAAVTQLETEKRALELHASGLRDELDQREIEEDHLKRELSSALTVSQRLLAQYAEAEAHGNNLAHLYVTTSRLHGTCNRDEVLRAIREVLGFFVGCDQAAIFELDEDAEYLKLVDAWGVDREIYWRVPVGRGRIGRAILSGEMYVAADHPAEAGPRHQDEEGLTACVPLKLEGRVSGAIALFRLQAQKDGRLAAADLELLNLLATHAATALYCTSMHERLQQQEA